MPTAVDLFCGLGGWTEGLLAEGYRVVGFDIEEHVYGEHRYPARLILADVLTLHGSLFARADLIVASPPCQEYSYMAMPWSKAKAKAAAIRADTTGAELARLTALFNACFRIQREASEAAGRHIPMVVENVRGAQPWVGKAQGHFGSFYLWGDVPPLPSISRGNARLKTARGEQWNVNRANFTGTQPWTESDRKNTGVKVPTTGAGWYPPDHPKHVKGLGFNTHASRNIDRRTDIIGKGTRFTTRDCGVEGTKNGNDWFGSGENCSEQRRHGSKSSSRKFASAMIAKIPLTLSTHIARYYHPDKNRLATEPIPC